MLVLEIISNFKKSSWATAVFPGCRINKLSKQISDNPERMGARSPKNVFKGRAEGTKTGPATGETGWKLIPSGDIREQFCIHVSTEES